MLYFVDGYHGGIRGHMPEGSWQDILYAMETRKDWKISLEVEPESFEYLRKHDLATYRRLQDFIREGEAAGRVEIISGSYAQPFCWAIGGESNIRQLLHGRRVHARHFPSARIDTYAVQEPCFTSSLPQILSQMGYKRMSLKNPTAWGGYVRKMPGWIVRLHGSDGSALPAVTRYECEELFSCSATEASGYDIAAIARFADKCEENGIAAPVGMCLQDLGWSSKPHVRDIPVEYVTYREYFERFGDRIQGDVQFSQEDILVSLPFGNIAFQQMLRTVRETENRILQVEKLLFIAETDPLADRDALRGARQRLVPAWEMLMQAQHHDGYICATQGEGTRQWAFRSNALAKGSQEILGAVSDQAMEALRAEPSDAPPEGDAVWLRVFNTTGFAREDQAQALLGFPHGYHDLEVLDAQGRRVDAQFTVTRAYEDGAIGAAVVRFAAKSAGLGYDSYRVVPKREPAAPAECLLRTTRQLFMIEAYTDHYHLMFDLAKGGAMVRFYDRDLKKDYAASADGFGAIVGYDVDLGRFISSTECMATCQILENGPLAGKFKMSGRFAGIAYETTVTVYRGSRRIDFETAARFDTERNIGYPLAPSEQEKYYGVKRSSCRDDYKLHIRLPMGSLPVKLYKSAAFDVCESQMTDTRFDGWDTIKHAILNGYADLYEPVCDSGLAVMADSVNSYSLAENVFTLTLAFGYHGNFWWGYQPLKGTARMRYSLMSHPGNWMAGEVAFAEALLREPLLVQRLPGEPAAKARQVLTLGGRDIELVTALGGDGPSIRLFNHSAAPSPLSLSSEPGALQGRAVNLLGEPMAVDQGRMRPFEIRTLC